MSQTNSKGNPPKEINTYLKYSDKSELLELVYIQQKMIQKQARLIKDLKCNLKLARDCINYGMSSLPKIKWSESSKGNPKREINKHLKYMNKWGLLQLVHNQQNTIQKQSESIKDLKFNLKLAHDRIKNTMLINDKHKIVSSPRSKWSNNNITK